MSKPQAIAETEPLVKTDTSCRREVQAVRETQAAAQLQSSARGDNHDWQRQPQVLEQEGAGEDLLTS